MYVLETVVSRSTNALSKVKQILKRSRSDSLETKMALLVFDATIKAILLYRFLEEGDT